jgi:hypothetical protein
MSYELARQRLQPNQQLIRWIFDLLTFFDFTQQRNKPECTTIKGGLII